MNLVRIKHMSACVVQASGFPRPLVIVGLLGFFGLMLFSFWNLVPFAFIVVFPIGRIFNASRLVISRSSRPPGPDYNAVGPAPGTWTDVQGHRTAECAKRNCVGVLTGLSCVQACVGAAAGGGSKRGGLAIDCKPPPRLQACCNFLQSSRPEKAPRGLAPGGRPRAGPRRQGPVVLEVIPPPAVQQPKTSMYTLTCCLRLPHAPANPSVAPWRPTEWIKNHQDSGFMDTSMVWPQGPMVRPDLGGVSLSPGWKQLYVAHDTDPKCHHLTNAYQSGEGLCLNRLGCYYCQGLAEHLEGDPENSESDKFLKLNEGRESLLTKKESKLTSHAYLKGGKHEHVGDYIYIIAILVGTPYCAMWR